MNTTDLIHASGTVLAAIDASAYTASVADHAGWAAERLGSPLLLLHTLERAPAPAATDLSGSLALGAKSALLDELARADEARARIAQARGRELLGQASERVLAARGVQASVQMRHGALVDTLQELEHGVRLFVIGKRGEHADFARLHLGSNLERVVRAVHRPVLVAARAFRPVTRFLIAYDGSATARKCVEMVCASPLLKGASGELLLVGADSESSRAHLDWARSRLEACGQPVRTHREEGRPEAAIVQQAQALEVDLLVMGAYGHSRIRQLIVGSTTTHVLRSCQLPVLLLR